MESRSNRPTNEHKKKTQKNIVTVGISLVRKNEKYNFAPYTPVEQPTDHSTSPTPRNEYGLP